MTEIEPDPALATKSRSLLGQAAISTGDFSTEIVLTLRRELRSTIETVLLPRLETKA
jgi:hypothetical protein